MCCLNFESRSINHVKMPRRPAIKPKKLAVGHTTRTDRIKTGALPFFIIVISIIITTTTTTTSYKEFQPASTADCSGLRDLIAWKKPSQE